MAQTGFTPILLYGSSTASAVPSASNLTSTANGVELAVNYTDGILFYKGVSGAVRIFASRNALQQKGPIGYSTGKYYYGICNTTDSSTGVVAANTLYAIPIYISENVTFLSINLSQITVAAGTSARLGIYSKFVGTELPRALILDAGVVGTSTTGTKTISISQALLPGYYYLAVIFDGTPTVRGFGLQNSSTFTNVAIGANSADATTSANNLQSVSVAQAYGALPALFPTPTFQTNAGPRLCLGL